MECQVEVGVSQGSVLGGISFIIYNDGLVKGKLGAFTDDTTIICTGNTWDQVVNDANIKLKNIKDWLIENKHMLNKEQTVFFLLLTYSD